MAPDSTDRTFGSVGCEIVEVCALDQIAREEERNGPTGETRQDPQPTLDCPSCRDDGALIRTFDGGQTWRDRVRGGPYDTHTAATHALAPGRIYSAAGDGYFESTDAGDSWRSPDDGLRHRVPRQTYENPGSSRHRGPYS